MKIVSQLCLKQAIIQDGMSMPDSFEISSLFDLYALGGTERNEINALWRNDVFLRLTSSDAVLLYENFLDSFCQDKTAFGKRAEEWQALELKRLALEFLERMQALDKAALSAATEKDDLLSLVTAVNYYLNGVGKDIFLPLLRRADGHKCAEAAVLLLAFEPNRRQELFERLSNNIDFLTCGDDSLAGLKQYYNIKQEVNYD